MQASFASVKVSMGEFLEDFWEHILCHSLKNAVRGTSMIVHHLLATVPLNG